MSYSLTLHRLVENDTDEAYNWYEDKAAGLGERFLAELAVCYTKLELHPEYYGKLVRGYRRVVLNHFPYMVVYEVIENRVIVYAVFHFSRNVKHISGRKRSL